MQHTYNFISSLILTAQNGFGRDVEPFLALSRETWGEEILFDAVKDLPHGALLKKDDDGELMFEEDVDGELVLNAFGNPIPAVDPFGKQRTRLMYAAQAGDLPRLQWLLKRGARVALADWEGHTALHWAASTGRVGVLRELLARGAALEQKDVWGCTALGWAVFSGKHAAAEELMEQGASAGAMDELPAVLATLGNAAEHANVREYALKKLHFDDDSPLLPSVLAAAPSMAHMPLFARVLQANGGPEVHNPALLWVACNWFTRILRADPPPIDAVFELGSGAVVRRFVQLLSLENWPAIQLEVCKVLIGITSDVTDNDHSVIEAGAAPPLIELLRSPSEALRERALWALGNLAVESRDAVIKAGIFSPLFACITPSAEVSFLRIVRLPALRAPKPFPLHPPPPPTRTHTETSPTFSPISPHTHTHLHLRRPPGCCPTCATTSRPRRCQSSSSCCPSW